MPPEITRANLRIALSSRRPRKRRDVIRPRDKFGRHYTAYIGRDSGDLEGQIFREFDAPVVVPDHFHRVPADERWKMEINWGAYVAELKQGAAEWEALVKFHMKRLFGQLGAAQAARGEYHPDAIELVGRKPQDWRLVALAARGDKWCLGLQAEPTAAVRSLAPTPLELAEWAERTAIQKGRARPVIDAAFRLDPELERLLEESERAEQGFESDKAINATRAQRRMTPEETAPVVEPEPGDEDEDGDEDYETHLGDVLGDDGEEDDTRLSGTTGTPGVGADFAPPEMGTPAVAPQQPRKSGRFAPKPDADPPRGAA